ncbi:TIGR04551 family protein [Myxococcaceae bacterium JPH2]|nr:TIGR04551 family protein [Myxococcaceae bacterium JPH2]
MSHALLAALLVASSTATAQTPVPEGGTSTPAPTSAPAPTSPAAAASPAQDTPSRDELEQKLEAAKKELREEIRAQAATQSVSSGWQEEWTEEKRKLEMLNLDGYLRVRPVLFYKFNLGKPVRAPGQPNGLEIFPRSPRSANEKTQAGADMRVRLEPTVNVSEDVRVKLQVDALDNLVLGSTPDSFASADGRNTFSLFSDSQSPPSAGINALKDSIVVRRAYGEVSTPVGILRFGRMGSHWGLGMLRNDGNCLDCDFGDTVDRIQFVTEPFAGWYITPMLDFNSEGPTSELKNSMGEPVDLTQSDDSHSLVLAIARRDTDQQARAKLENNQGVLNYGLYFTYRTQAWAATGYESTGNANSTDFVQRDAHIYTPDLWLKYEEQNFRLEFEFAAVLGNVGNSAQSAASAGAPLRDQSLRIAQFGGVAQGEVHLTKSRQLHLGLELGFASGDKAFGMGNYPGRSGTGSNGTTAAGDVEGPQYGCTTDGACDNAIRNFRFNRDYRVDMILWRELLGGVTDAFYVKPTLRYSVAEGFDVFGSVIYSQAFYAESTPSAVNHALGLEVDVGARYETEDGFVAGISYGILFPMGGLKDAMFLQQGLNQDLRTPQSIRGMLAIKY